MFADEARFGRINRPRPCWAPPGARPEVASQLIREYIYLYGAVCPRDGTCFYLIMPTSDTACFQTFLDALARKHSRHDILLVVDGAPNHRGCALTIPGLRPADSAPPTNFSPSWRRSDYAASFTAIIASQADLATPVGIIRSSA